MMKRLEFQPGLESEREREREREREEHISNDSLLMVTLHYGAVQYCTNWLIMSEECDSC